MNIEKPVNGHWLFSAVNPHSEVTYLKFHTELTLLAFLQTNDLELAKDIASEVLVGLWLTTSISHLKAIKQFLIGELQRLLQEHRKVALKRLAAEEEHIRSIAMDPPLYRKFCMDQRLFLLELSSKLPPVEQAFLQLCLVQELDMDEIRGLLDKPFRSLENIRNLTIYDLKKLIRMQKEAHSSGMQF